MLAIITTLALSVRDVLLTIKYDTGQLSDNLVVVDNSLNKRIAIFGIAITAPFFIISIASIISFLIENRLNFVWVISADFAMSTMPWITFVFFGTTSEATRKYLPRCCFPQENRNNIPVKPSTINQSLRKSINVPSLPSREPSPDDLTREIKIFPQTPQLNFGMPSGSTVSTFSQRAGPNSTDPFSHRKNPSLTIKIDPIEPANGSKIINFRTSRIRKGKERMTTLRKSFLRKTNTDDSIDNYNYLSGSVNKYSSKNKKIDVSRGKSSAFYETATPNRRSPRNTIIKENKIEKCEFLDETKNYLLKQFSFEKRQKSESIIEIPSEFGIKTHSQNSSLSIQTDNHIISQPSISQMITMDNSQNIVPLSQSENMISGREAELKNKQIEITVGVNNESSSSTNATFGSALTSKSIELTGTNNSFLDQDYAESSNNNHLDHSPSLGLPSTPSFGTMAMHSTTSRTNTQSSSSSSKSSKTTVTNNRSSTGTTRSSNGFTLTPRGSRAFNNAMRLVIGNDNGSSSPALDDENEQRMRELRQIVEEFDDQTSFKSPNSSQ
ncbi:28014_t:CDS:2 [Gigaspora margarita]|uniref:28014_t:CDS:1 n=1 Tax=Gigaspora margarita TaxID=4874 RepID=A0ABN7UDL7_GIGMA|nr:28014_t:CDS:2 [Gigaspora margarita]